MTIVQRIKTHLHSNQLLKNILTILSGTLLMQLIIFLSSPILTRLLSPSDFGLYGLYISSLGILSIFISGRYELAIMIPKHNITAHYIATLCIIITTGSSLIIIILCALIKPFILPLFETIHIHPVFYLVPCHIWILKINEILNYSLNREQRFKIISANKILQGAIITITTLLTALFPIKTISLILGALAGHITSLCFLSYHSHHIITPRYFINKKKLGYCLKRFKKFPIYQCPGSLINKLSSESPIFLLTKFYGLEAAGFFSFANRIVGTPLSLISQSTAEAFRQRAANQYNTLKTCRPFFLKTTKQLLLLFTPPILILTFFAPQLFEYIFGNEWQASGKMIQIMSVMLLLRFGVSPLAGIIIQISERLDIDIIWQILLIIGIILSLIGGHIFFHNIFYSIALYTLWYFTMYTSAFFIAYKFSKKKNIIK